MAEGINSTDPDDTAQSLELVTEDVRQVSLRESNLGQLGAYGAGQQQVVIEGGTFNQPNIGPTTINQEITVTIQETTINTKHGQSEHACYETYAQQFLDRCTVYLDKILGERKQLKLDSEPVKMILEMEGQKGNAFQGSKDDSSFGRNVERIELHQIHAPFNSKKTRHAMILGEAGAGKTTLSKMYSAAAADGKILYLNDVKLVHYVNVFHLQCDSASTAFDMLFTQQMNLYPETQLNDKTRQAGMRWVKENQKDMLITIDGLDQCRKQVGRTSGHHIDYMTKAKCDGLLSNIMSGGILPGARILTTSRWSAFWNLMAEQRPQKVIGLRGFDETNLEMALHHHIRDEQTRNSLKDRLTTGSPKVLALYRNPMFLKYAAETFQENNIDLADTLSGLMSSVFLRFLQSDHCKDPDLDCLTKLAYHGTFENRFEFSVRYLKTLDVVPNNLEGFFSMNAVLQPDQAIAKSCDKSYMFSHQSMQEFCAALHVLNFDPQDVEKVVRDLNNLENDAIEAMRKHLYGIIMNDITTYKLKRYFDDRACSIIQCRKILTNNLKVMMKNGVISDIRLITLLNECGNEAIQSLKTDINTIRISDVLLLQQDQIILASMIKQCSPLVDVYVQEFLLNEALLHALKGCHESVGKFQVGYEVEDTINIDNVPAIIDLLEIPGILYVHLHCADDVKIAIFSRLITKAHLGFEDFGATQISQMSSLKLLLQMAKMFRPNDLTIGLEEGVCHEIMGEDLSMFGLKLQSLYLEDKGLNEEGFCELTAVLQVPRSKQLTLYRCDLNEKKLSSFWKECQKSNVQLDTLSLRDKNMNGEGYSELASVVEVTRCQKMVFHQCDLNDEKLCQFWKQCKSLNVRLDTLYLQDKNMNGEGYSELASVLKVTRCQVLVLTECDLNDEKLCQLWKQCKSLNVRAKILNLSDELIFSNCPESVGKDRGRKMPKCCILL